MKPARSESFFSLTEAAWKRTVTMLFRPFRWHVWWRLLFIAFVSGQLSAGWAGPNMTTNLNQGRSHQQPVKPQQPENAVTSSQDEGKSDEKIISIPQDAKGAEVVGLPVAKPPLMTYESIVASLEKARAWVQQYGVVISLLIVLVLAIQVLWTWLAARFAFVFIDVIVTRRVEIVQPFKRWGAVAQSYFKWSIAILALLWLGLIGLVWGSISAVLRVYAKTPTLPLDDFLNKHTGLLIGSLSGFIIGVILWALLWMIFWVWLTDFVLPIMYHRRCTMLESWKMFLPLVRAAPGEAVKYLLWKMLIAFAVGVAYALLVVIGILLAVLVVGLVIALGVLVAKALPILKIPLLVLGILGIVGMLVLFLLVVWMLMLPPSMLFRTFSLEYLRSLRVGYDLLPEPGT